jgi:hypothetical protein
VDWGVLANIQLINRIVSSAGPLNTRDCNQQTIHLQQVQVTSLEHQQNKQIILGQFSGGSLRGRYGTAVE